MNILKRAVVLNSEMIKSYNTCRKKAESLGKIFIFEDNKPDAVLFSINEYEKLSMFIEHWEIHKEREVARIN